LEVLPAASCLASQPFFNKDISFECYYTKMPPSNPHGQSESFSFSPLRRSPLTTERACTRTAVPGRGGRLYSPDSLRHSWKQDSRVARPHPCRRNSSLVLPIGIGKDKLFMGLVVVFDVLEAAYDQALAGYAIHVRQPH
jgi:hypothetical protein